MNISQILKFLSLLVQFYTVYCGRGTFSRKNDDSFQMLIAGGIIPENGKFIRNLVSIRTLNYIEYPGDNHFCTGVVISSRTILTAAHCVTDRHKAVMNPRGLLIVFGSVYRLERYGSHDSRRVDRIVVHPSFKRYYKDDVAILRLKDRIPGNMRHVKPIIKRKRITVTEGMRCVTLGWGQVYPHGPYANEVMYLDVIVRSPSHCKDIDHFIEECNICVEPDSEGQVCAGDLGGPLMCGDYLTGIIGGAQKCEGIKSIKFVNYSHVESWVDETVLALSASSSMRLSLYIFILCQLKSYLNL